MPSPEPAPEGARAPGRPAPGRFPCLDAYRGIGMIMVVMAHASFASLAHVRGTFAGSILARFDVVLPMFFELSAFLLYLPFVRSQLLGRPQMPVRQFYRHRFLRIYPGYWVALVVSILFLGVEPHSVTDVILFFPILQIYDSARVFSPAFQPIYQTWSLATELMFYALLPLWAQWAQRRTAGRSVAEQCRFLLTGCAVLYAVGTAFRIYVIGAKPSWWHQGILWFPTWADFFAIGMAFAVVHARYLVDGTLPRALRALGERPWLCWTIAGVIFMAMTRFQPPPQPLVPNFDEYIPRQFVYGFIAAFWLLPGMFGDQQHGLIRRVLRSAPLFFLGTVSYGFYLYHVAWLDEIERWTGAQPFRASFVTLVLLGIPLALGSAVLSYYLVERPFLAAKDRPLREVLRTWPRVRPRPAAGAA